MMMCAVDRVAALPSSRHPQVLCSSTAIQTDVQHIGETPSTEPTTDVALIRPDHFTTQWSQLTTPLAMTVCDSFAARLPTDTDNNADDDDEKSCSDDDINDDYGDYQTGDPELDELINSAVYDNDDLSCASDSITDDLVATLDDQFTIVEGEPDPDVAAPSPPTLLTAASATSAYLSAQITNRSGAFLDWAPSSLSSRSFGPLIEASPCDLVNPLSRFRTLTPRLQMTSSLGRITLRQGEAEPEPRATLSQTWSNNAEGQRRSPTLTSRLQSESVDSMGRSLIYVREGN